MLPNMMQSVWLASQPLVINNNVQTVVNNRPVQVPTTRTIIAVVQPANPEQLLVDEVDFHLRYLDVHTLPESELKINDTCEYRGATYKCIFLYPEMDYIYRRSIFEEVK